MSETSRFDETDQSDESSRLVAAFSKAAGEQGYARLDVDTVARYAGLSPDFFREHFTGTEQALVAAQEAFLKRLLLDIESACESAAGWPEKVQAAVAAVVDSLVEASAIARVFAIEAPGVSLAAAERQFSSLDRLAGLLREGRSLYPESKDLPELTERALIGGTVSVVSQHLLAENPQAIRALEPQLTEFLLGPYLGKVEAHRIAVRRERPS